MWKLATRLILKRYDFASNSYISYTSAIVLVISTLSLYNCSKYLIYYITVNMIILLIKVKSRHLMVSANISIHIATLEHKHILTITTSDAT